MSVDIDQDHVCRSLAPLLDDAGFRKGVAHLADDPFMVAHFLVSVSQGEGLGEAAVGMIGQEEVACFIDDLKRQEREERGHKEQTLEAARELFPDCFDGGRYRYDGALEGATYYLAVLHANRDRLRRLGRFSRLNQYLTTTFGYEIMVVLLYRAVADAIAASRLAAKVSDRVVGVLESILAEEETHLGVIDQHNALLATSRRGLSDEACDLLEVLGSLEESDYTFPARRAVEQLVAMMTAYEDPALRREEIEASVASRE
jgi:hypothetical protein